MRLIKVSLTENQYIALLSFVFNLGGGALQASTLRRKLNMEDYEGAAEEFKKWNKAGGRIVKGLTKRREAERIMFLS
jgi:lysozyme